MTNIYMDSDHPRILLRKPRIRALRNNPRIVHANRKSTCNHLGSRNQISAVCGNKPTIDCARKAAWPSMATNPRSIALAKQLRHPRQQTLDQSHTNSGSAGYDPTIINHVNAVAIIIQLARSIVVCCRGWPRFGCAILNDCVWIRGLHSKS